MRSLSVWRKASISVRFNILYSSLYIHPGNNALFLFLLTYSNKFNICSLMISMYEQPWFIFPSLLFFSQYNWQQQQRMLISLWLVLHIYTCQFYLCRQWQRQHVLIKYSSHRSAKSVIDNEGMCVCVWWHFCNYPFVQWCRLSTNNRERKRNINGSFSFMFSTT